jgi:hypothetical protein
MTIRSESAPIIFLDFEASALGPRGYPIEVGWAMVDPREQVTVRALLIRPTEAWADWEWSPESARVHSITRDVLDQNGLPVHAVAETMNAELAGRVVHSDHPRGDGFWLRVLFGAAGLEPAFLLKDVASVFEGVSDLAYEQAVERGKRPPVTHRAGDDALHWARKYMAAVAWDRDRS